MVVLNVGQSRLYAELAGVERGFVAGAGPPEVSAVLRVLVGDVHVPEELDHRLRPEPELRNWPLGVVGVVHVGLIAARAFGGDFDRAPGEVGAKTDVAVASVTND